MRDQDLDALRRGYEAWNQGDVESVIKLVAPDIEWVPGQDAPEAGRFTGRDAFETFIMSWSESFDDFRLEPEEITVVGDRAIVEVHQVGRGRRSGIELDTRAVHVWTIREGTAVAWSAYRNRAEALAAIGESS